MVAMTTAVAGTPPPQSGQGQILERRHLLLVTICTFGFMVDMAEIAIASALGAIFTDAGGHTASTPALSMLLSSIYVGGAIGAVGFGLLAKRSSTRFALSLAMGVLAAGSLASALSPNIEWLIVARTVSGIGIGAYPPLAVALLATHLPARWRAPVLLTVSAIGSLGAPLSIYVTRELSRHPLWQIDGWQSVLIGGAVISTVLCVGFALIRGFEDEPPLAAEPAHAGVDPVPTRQERLTALVILPVLYVFVHWVSTGFALLSGITLLYKGFSLNDTLLFVTGMFFGPSLGTLLSGVVIDRMERRDAILCTLIVGALAIIVFGAFNAVWIVAAAAVTFGMSLGLYVPVMSLYAAEFYPRATRSQATSRLWALNRAGLVVAPLALLPLLRATGPLMLTIVLAVILILCAALVRLAPRGHAGKELR